PGGDALGAGHLGAGGGAPDARGARALQARAAYDAADADLGAHADRAWTAHSVPAAAPYRQHAHRPRRFRRRRQLSLRAGAPVALQRLAAELAPADGVAARVHRHPLLAAALPALPWPAAGVAVYRYRRAARRARRLHGLGPARRLLDRGCADLRQAEGADALAERRGR